VVFGENSRTLVLAKREVSGKLACDEEDKLTPDTE
jgi:hypothetical protein